MTALERQIIEAIQKARNTVRKPKDQIETMVLVERFLLKEKK